LKKRKGDTLRRTDKEGRYNKRTPYITLLGPTVEGPGGWKRVVLEEGNNGAFWENIVNSLPHILLFREKIVG